MSHFKWNLMHLWGKSQENVVHFFPYQYTIVSRHLLIKKQLTIYVWVYLAVLICSIDLPYFSDYMTHRSIRHTYVLEEKNRKKTFEAKNVVLLLFPVTALHCCRPSPPPPTPASQESYIQTTRHAPILLPNLGSASYSPKNMVYVCHYNKNTLSWFLKLYNKP